jgi:uncharacterized protein
MEDFAQRKLLSALCHGSIFFSSLVVSIGIPIAVLFMAEDPVVKENAKEAINFHINLYLYAIIFSLLIFVVIGIPLLVLLGVASFVMPIIAIVQTLSEYNRPYHYPLIWRLV